MKMCMIKAMLVLAVLVVFAEAEVTPQGLIQIQYHSIGNISVEANTDKLIKQIKHTRTKMRCASLCVESGCKCASFSFDGTKGVCYIFDKALISGNGNATGANKMTECATPKKIPNAYLLRYTGCWATYSCNSGYINRGPSHTITCQSGEIWPNKDVVICKATKHSYEFRIMTADTADIEGVLEVFIILYGEYDQFHVYIPDTLDFSRGTTTVFSSLYRDVGKLLKITIRLYTIVGDTTIWHLQSVIVIVGGTDVFEFKADAQLSAYSPTATLEPYDGV